ncbi:MAG: hypothetical protein IPK52_27665 [Chloroflexi bacterium]|nr:hypothetical protein [Chloroflexota bacterium]
MVTDNDPTDQFVAGSFVEVWLIKDTAVVTAVSGGSGVLQVSTANISTPDRCRA